MRWESRRGAGWRDPLRIGAILIGLGLILMLSAVLAEVVGAGAEEFGWLPVAGGISLVVAGVALSRRLAGRSLAVALAVSAAFGAFGVGTVVGDRLIANTGPAPLPNPLLPPPPPDVPPRAAEGGRLIGDGTGGIRLEQVADLDSPTFLAQPPGEEDLLYAVERDGRIVVIRDGTMLPRPFLDLRPSIPQDLGFAEDERGAFSIAFPPDYEESRLFYVAYYHRNDSVRLSEFARSESTPLRADPEERVVIEVPQPTPLHNGGQAAFGPDGFLYLGLGDGGPSHDPEYTPDPRGDGQNRGTLLGSIIRIDPRETDRGWQYSVPADNPFLRFAGRDEIVAYGLRNPWRFSFDRATGNVLISDVGDREIEELNLTSLEGLSGANFGWSGFEGDEPFRHPGRVQHHIPPVHTYRHEGDRCAVVGGYVVRDRNLTPLFGRYVYADLCDGELRSFIPTAAGARDDRLLDLEVSFPTSFAEDARGRIYVLSGDEGGVYRLREG